ncbi:MAG: hypothetical protein CMK07_14025 [Ponticaulis sp.]|nr:hypothetical protein [Ponticaulis sp.]
MNLLSLPASSITLAVCLSGVAHVGSIEGRALDQTYEPKSDSAFDLTAKIGGEERVVSCRKVVEMIG